MKSCEKCIKHIWQQWGAPCSFTCECTSHQPIVPVGFLGWGGSFLQCTQFNKTAPMMRKSLWSKVRNPPVYTHLLLSRSLPLKERGWWFHSQPADAMAGSWLAGESSGDTLRHNEIWLWYGGVSKNITNGLNQDTNSLHPLTSNNLPVISIEDQVVAQAT